MDKIILVQVKISKILAFVFDPSHHDYNRNSPHCISNIDASRSSRSGFRAFTKVELILYQSGKVCK